MRPNRSCQSTSCSPASFSLFRRISSSHPQHSRPSSLGPYFTLLLHFRILLRLLRPHHRQQLHHYQSKARFLLPSSPPPPLTATTMLRGFLLRERLRGSWHSCECTALSMWAVDAYVRRATCSGPTRVAIDLFFYRLKISKFPTRTFSHGKEITYHHLPLFTRKFYLFRGSATFLFQESFAKNVSQEGISKVLKKF